jgi:hypothetical protein
MKERIVSACSYNSLFLPNPPSDPQFELLPVATREAQGHVPLDDEPVVAIPNFPVAISDASRDTLPGHLTINASNLQAVGVVLSFNIVSHEPEEGDVDRRHPQLEGLEVQAEVLAKAAENLYKYSRVSYHGEKQKTEAAKQ